jgi:BAG domain-containing protein
VASPGALANITALLPPSLQSAVDRSLTTIAATLADSSQYIADTLGVDPNLVLYSTIGCLLLAVPLVMSRYGWSSITSPYGPSSAGGVPNITNDDFSYITSEDLQDPLSSGRQTRYYTRTERPPPAPEDDILILKNKGANYPAHFPAYSIGDGKLRVSDIRNRIAVELDISDRRARRAKILYKGRQLKEPAAPVRDYGVKNKSEIMIVVPDSGASESSSVTDEEMVIVAEEDTGPSDAKKRRNKKKSKKGKRSPRDDDSGSNNSSLPAQGSDFPGPSSNPAALAKLREIDADFMATLYPMAQDFIARPPTDPKKLVDEHRRISETTMQNILLKLDAVEPNGDQETRMRRKELVQKVQNTLKDLDDAKARVA